MVLQYSSAAISIDMNERVRGALVQFGCYQHRHKYSDCDLYWAKLELS